MKIFKKIIIVLLLLLVIVQFFQPEKNEGEITSVQYFIEETKPNDVVHKILKTACFDCHSNLTRYPWYSSITPVNYWLADHVNHGKEELNFSEWATYSLKRKEHKMKEVWEEVEKGKMPLDSYTWMHADARLSKEEVQQITEWAKSVQNNYQTQLAN
ncbi:heme-binding domain-containing protein [Tenacibaculum sp. Mcav3-52]|uniref:heme-binding domain-containing protein n=1 Tax=Tenacibaculum sp. Mcav3-52 TaxID=2917762 RepID=UPI001EF2E1CD|nr:heme-binding domain-containing protein [Tenacibaculum sp. Mcav3-52]MCG7501881.1 heme-binding domain-containing protein [Tenacibaculum sp. Mcav3-52]